MAHCAAYILAYKIMVMKLVLCLLVSPFHTPSNTSIKSLSAYQRIIITRISFPCLSSLSITSKITPKAEPIVFLEAPEIFPNLKNPTSKTLFDGMILEKLVMFALYAGAESHQAKDIVHDRYLTFFPQVCDPCPDKEWIIHHLTMSKVQQGPGCPGLRLGLYRRLLRFPIFSGGVVINICW